VKRLLTLDEAAHLLQLPPKTLYSQRHRHVEPGSLAIRVGRWLRFDESELVQYIERQKKFRLLREE
jgi:predicted DNA-binding transcriptional regulator AlpA